MDILEFKMKINPEYSEILFSQATYACNAFGIIKRSSFVMENFTGSKS